MNNIYVDGDEKICVNCPFLYSNSQGAVCKLSGHLTKWTETFEDMKSKCQIKPLSDRLAEERKKVVQELKKMMPIFFGKSEFDWEGFNDYLDQIERGE